MGSSGVSGPIRRCAGGRRRRRWGETWSPRVRPHLVDGPLPLGRWIPGVLGSPPGWPCCAVSSSSSGALTAGRRLPGGLLPRAPHYSAPAPHALFPCRPPSGRGRAGYGQSSRGGRTTGSGWLRPSAGPSKAPGLRALVQEGPGAPCLGHPPGPLSGCPAGEGCCAPADQRWPPAHRQRQTLITFEAWGL